MNTAYSSDKLSHGPTASVVGATSSPTAHSKIPRSAKKLHPKSLSRDAAFVRSFRELAKSGSLGTAFLPLVCICASKRLLPAPTSCTSSACSYSLLHAQPRLQGPPRRLPHQPPPHAGSRPGTNGSNIPPTELIGLAHPGVTPPHTCAASSLTMR
jgi:hypothetical protein